MKEEQKKLNDNYTELKANEKLLYAIITSLACKEGYCFASNKYLAEKLDVNPKTISSWISDLKNKNFIVVELIRNENNQIIVYLENKQIQENTQEQYNQLIQADRNTMTTELPTYSCKVMNYNSDGRIKEIKFNKK